MLPHYSPLKVAESFSLLSGLFPGRIDLGIGRAAGTDPVTTHVLQRDRRQAPPDDFFDQLAELLAYLEDRFPDDHPLKRLTALPGLPEAPEPWLLGSSPQSAIWAADLGMPYAFADFINSDGGVDIARLYRERFADSERLRHAARPPSRCGRSPPTPRRRPQRLAYSSRMAMAMLRRGRLIAVPPVEKAERFLKGEGLLDKPARPPARARHARRGPRRARAGRGRLPRRGGDRGLDHLRPRGPPALLRADRRGLRARRRRSRSRPSCRRGSARCRRCTRRAAAWAPSGRAARSHSRASASVRSSPPGQQRSRSRAVRTTVSACVRAASDVSRPVDEGVVRLLRHLPGLGYPLARRARPIRAWGRYLPRQLLSR